MASCDEQDWQLSRKTVSERNIYMFNNALMSDVKFTCGDTTGKCFNAHKYVLATSSPVFYNMFYGELAEVKPVIDLPDTDDESMEEFLRFLYTDKCILNPKNALKLMYLANKYKVPSLAEKCSEELMKGIKADNVATIVEQAARFDEKELEEKCWNVVEEETSKVVTSQCFLEISQPTLSSFLQRERLNIEEVELFKAVVKWCDNQCLKGGSEANGENRRQVIGDALHHIALLSMTQKEFTQNVKKSGLLTPHETLAIYAKFDGDDDTAIKWNIPSRYNNYTSKPVEYHRFTRCTKSHVEPENPGGYWNYQNGNPDSLCFSSNKKVNFHGVRLFGDKNNSNYDVTFEAKNAKVSGTYISGKDNDGIPGFDVMLSRPVVVEPNERIRMSAKINGPNSHSIKGGIPSVQLQEVEVTFSVADEPTNGTDSMRGQFYQLIVSFM